MLAATGGQQTNGDQENHDDAETFGPFSHVGEPFLLVHNLF